MDQQTGPKGFLVVLPGEIIEIPQDSDKSWLTLFYSLPRELAEKWKPAYELPRCPYEVLRTDKYDHIVCDDMFKLLVWDCYAWCAWQFFQVKDRKGNYRDIPGNWNQYAGYFPLWRLSYSIIPYIRMKFEQNGLGFQNLYNIPQGVEVPWLTYQHFSNLVGNVTDMVIAEQNWQPMIDAIWENRTVEDYETTSSTVKTDFMRMWHHNRSGKPISLDEMMENEDGDIFEVADPRGEFEQKVISEMQIAAFAEQSITEKDREILKLRMDGLTEQEIADKVGYKTASAVHKRIAKIAGAYEDYVTAEYQKYLDKYGEDSDYTRKGGVICSEILLPSHAPPEYADRETLWNAVEKAERGKKAQLAYSFDIALQNEFSMQENIALARQFLLENFVSRGMVVDFAVHSPDKEDVGISNPHFHVMCPIRPIEPDGRWGNKQRREYVLDEHGERVLDEAGNYVFNAVSTTDWGKPETLEAWRQAWADLCNAKFAEKNLECRIDHRSFARQGVEQIPTQHEGPTVRAMEAKGIRTDKGDLNRLIRKTNALLREAKEKIAALIGWLKDVKAELAKPQPPTLNDLLALHCSNRNKGAYSNKAKNANLQRYAEAFSFLQSKNLYTVDDLDNALHAMQDKIDTLKKSASAKQSRIKEVDELLRMVDYYKSGKPAADKLKSIRFEKSRQKYKAEHDDELRTFYMAERKLKLHFKDGKLPITAWRREREQLEQEYRDIQTELSPLHADAKKLWAIHYNIYEVQHEQERQNAVTRQKKQEIEH